MQFVRHNSFPIFTAFCLCLTPMACQSQQQKAAGIKELKARLESTGTRADYDSLHFYLVEHYTGLSAKERSAVREVLKKHAVWPFENVCPDTEPGVPITISGRLVADSGKPVPAASVHIFQTNSQGYYSPGDATTGRMMEKDPRLEGFLTTDSSGVFSIRTIHPASYPKKYEGRLIPAHIHLVVQAAGFHQKAVQMVFEDDPALTEYWMEWARKNGFPIIRLETTEKGARGEVTLKLTPL